MRICFLLLMLLLPLPLHPRHVFIVIHGTWSLERTWYVPGGDFFDALESSMQGCDACVVPFCWSGKNSPEARQKAARHLAQLIETYERSTDITLIAHSHGGNVAFLASQLLKKNNIFCLYALGTPINSSIYPNMDSIRYCYNFLSFEDLIQPVFGMFERELSAHKRIANIRIIINGKEPDHTDLHHKIIGTWLVRLHDIIMQPDKKIMEPGVLHFTDTAAPLYSYDIQRKELLERDHRLAQLILYSLRKKNNHSRCIAL